MMSEVEWSGDPTVADPEGIEAVGHRVMVRPVPAVKKTRGGLVLPDTAVDSQEFLTSVGRVLSIGPNAWKRADLGPDAWCEVGDYVTYGTYVGHRFKFKGVKLVVLNDDQLMTKVDEPDGLRTVY